MSYCFGLAFAYIPITPHFPAWANDSAHVWIWVGWLNTLFSVWVCATCAFSAWKRGRVQQGELGTTIFSTALLQYMCNYIPPLIENRALPQSSCNKELLFSFCVYLQVCVATATSYPWVFPLMLSSRLIPYRKLITDWLGSCFPLISHGPAWGFVLRGWLRWDREQ